MRTSFSKLPSSETRETEVPPAHTPHRISTHEPHELFQSLELDGSRGRAFSTSVGFHVVMLLVLLAVPMVFTDTLKPKFDTVLLAPPPDLEVLEVTPYREPIAKPVPRPPEKIVAPPPLKPLVTEVRPPEPPKVAEV